MRTHTKLRAHTAAALEPAPQQHTALSTRTLPGVTVDKGPRYCAHPQRGEPPFWPPSVWGATYIAGISNSFGDFFIRGPRTADPGEGSNHRQTSNLVSRRKNFGYNFIAPLPQGPRSMARDYRSEYDNYHARPEQKKNRASRNAARAKLAKAGRVSKGDGKDVSHRNGNPRDNSPGNLKVQPKSRNRSFPRKNT